IAFETLALLVLAQSDAVRHPDKWLVAISPLCQIAVCAGQHGSDQICLFQREPLGKAAQLHERMQRRGSENFSYAQRPDIPDLENEPSTIALGQPLCRKDRKWMGRGCNDAIRRWQVLPQAAAGSVEVP